MKTKICYKCKKDKSITEFHKNKRKKDGLRIYCKKCKSEYDKEYRRKNKKRNKQKNLEYRKKNREKIKKKRDILYKVNRKFVENIKLKSGCKMCGYNEHPAALVFHHINPQNKNGTIKISNTQDKILQEISKCIVLCANCHRILHYTMRRKNDRYL